MPWSDYPLRSIVIPQDAGPGDPRIEITPTLPPPLDTYLYLGTTDLIGGIIFYRGTPGDQDYGFIVQAETASELLILQGFVRAGVVVEFAAGDPAGFQWSADFGGSAQPDLFALGRLWTGLNTDTGLYVGDIRASPAWATTGPWAGPAVGGTTTSATYVTMPNAPTITLTKQADAAETIVVGRLYASGFSTAVPTEVGYGVLVDGTTDVGVDLFRINVANQHLKMCAAEFVIPDLDAGDHTFVARWLRNVAVGTLTFDDRGRASLTVEERPIEGAP